MKRHRGRRVAALVVSAACAGAVVAGCSNPSHGDDAKKLAQSLRDAPGVQTVALRYSEPVTLDSGKVALTVAMDSQATGAEISGVVESAYEAFRTTHRDEESDLRITSGDDVLTVRAFQPRATTKAVVAAAAAPLSISDDGAITGALMTQDVPSAPHVSTETTVRLGEGTTADDVLPEFDRLAATFPADPLQTWTVRAADRSGLGTAPGFPSSSQIALWHDLEAASDGLGEGAAVFLRDIPERHTPLRLVDTEVGDVDLDGDAAQIAPIVAAAQRQIDLTRIDGGWSYTLTRDGEQVALVDPDLCDPATTLNDTPNAVDDALRTPANCPNPPTDPLDE